MNAALAVPKTIGAAPIAAERTIIGVHIAVGIYTRGNDADAACSIYTSEVLWQRGRLLGLRFINPLKHDYARKRMLDHLNRCTTYAWARAA